MAVKQDAEDIADRCSRILAIIRFANAATVSIEDNPDLTFSLTNAQRDALKAKVANLQAEVKTIAGGW